MRRVGLVVLMALTLTARTTAQPMGTIENLRDKAVISNEDREQIRRWLEGVVGGLVGSTETRLRIAARSAILYEAGEGGRTPAFIQALQGEAVAVLKAAEPKAISPEARINFMMTLAELRTVEGVPMLRAALEKDPYPASRYWAAKGMALVAPVIRERVVPRVEAEIAETIGKVLDNETSTAILLHMFDALGQYDHERAHDVLAEAAGKVAMRFSASDPVVAQILGGAVTALERAYGREVRPEAKKDVLMAYATLCTWIMPPTANPKLMTALNAALEKITGEKVGFAESDDPVMQKLALLEWVEKLVRDKRIPKRPPVPPAVDAAVKEFQPAN